jgi:DNA-binding transcriptional LysR family regulator
MRIESKVDLSYLKYFYAVAKAGGFSRAAKLLGVQQPSITRGVKNLEEQLGVRLFERLKRQVRLTAAGREIYAICEKIYSEAGRIEAVAHSLTQECKGALKFAAASPISTFLIPEALEAFLRKYPEVWPQTSVGTLSDLVPRILQSDLEFGLFFYVPELPVDLAATSLGKMRFRLVIAAGEAANDQVKARFIGSREIEDGSAHRFPTLERLRKDVPEAKLAISTNDISAHREMVLRGLGVAILPEFAIADDLRAKRLRDLYPAEELWFDLQLITARNAVLTRPARLFLEEIRSIRGLLSLPGKPASLRLVG